MLLAMVLVELLLIGFHRVPFTCRYVPGKANVKLLWPLYLFAMTTYVHSTARVETRLLADLSRWGVACALVLLGLALAKGYRDVLPSSPSSLV